MQTALAEQTNKTPAKKRYNFIDVGKALSLRINDGLSYDRIAAILSKEQGRKVSKQGVWERLKPFERLIEDPQAIKAYESKKEDLLSAVEAKLLVEMLDPAKLKSATLNNVAYAFQQIFNANRLQRDKSTSNLSVRSVVEDIRKRREELRQKHGDNCQNSVDNQDLDCG